MNFIQKCIPIGYVPSAAVAICWGVSAPGGVSTQGCLARGVSGQAVSGWGGVWPGGMFAQGVSGQEGVW